MSDIDSLKPYFEVIDNPVVHAVGSWKCENHDEQTDEEAYVAKAVADVDAFSDKLDQALSLI